MQNAEEAKNKRKKRISESADDIEVVYEKEQPRIHGILKQRSRTQSESSCDETFGIPMYNRQHSSASFSGSNESSLMESDENTDSSGRKKSVSFSEHIDETSYKSNSSVNTLKATLKNRRRKQRKRDHRKETKQWRRRRTSSCSEFSSDDQGSSHSSIERSNSLDDLKDQELDADDPPVTVPTPLTSSADEIHEVTKENSAPEPKKNEVFEEASVDEGVSENVSVSPGDGHTDVRTNDEICADDYGTSKGDEPANERDSNVISGSDTAESTAKSKKTNKKSKKQSSEGVKHESSETGDRANENESVDGERKDGGDNKKSDSMLSWEDRKEVLDPLGQHEPKCSFSFTNSVIYDLDVE